MSQADVHGSRVGTREPLVRRHISSHGTAGFSVPLPAAYDDDPCIVYCLGWVPEGSLAGFLLGAFLRSRRPRGPPKGLQKCGGRSPPHFYRPSRAPGAGETSKMHPNTSGQIAFRYPDDDDPCIVCCLGRKGGWCTIVSPAKHATSSNSASGPYIGLRAGFWPDCYREGTEMGPPAGRRPVGGPISLLSR
jgi:hypothetical protein